jgi:1-acyl-sn-glycerol-3-phosphate acyltransferase
MWLNRLTGFSAPLFRLYWDLRIEFEGGPVPMNEPLILAPNHASFLDPWYLIWMFPRPMHHLINPTWYGRSRAWRIFFDAYGTVPIFPSDTEATLAAVRKVLDRNQSICIFPEGRVSADGRLQRFRPGIAWFAAVTGVPVIPIGIAGAYESLPRHRKFPKRGTITIRVGEPMRFPSPGPDPDRRETIAFVRQVRDEVARLSGQSESDAEPR